MNTSHFRAVLIGLLVLVAAAQPASAGGAAQPRLAPESDVSAIQLAQAGRRGDPRDRRPGREEDKDDRGDRKSALTLDQAIKMVEARFKARVVRRETRQEKGRKVYVLRLFDEKSGRVWTVRVDAASGRIY